MSGRRHRESALIELRGVSLVCLKELIGYSHGPLLSENKKPVGSKPDRWAALVVELRL
jgi:hypothetical protein